MATQITIDVTERVNNGKCIDVGSYDFAVFQIIGIVGTIEFYSTNDSGAVQGVTDGNANLAKNLMEVQGINLRIGGYINEISADGMLRFDVVGQFIALTGGTCTKCLLRLYKSH